MKTKLILILAIIFLNINLLSAHSYSATSVEGPTTSEATLSVASLAPVTPSEAIFEDATDINPIVSTVLNLAPVTPKVATFEEFTDEKITTVSAPVNQKVQTIEKGKTVHYEFPLPCDAKYGCSL